MIKPPDYSRAFIVLLFVSVLTHTITIYISYALLGLDGLAVLFTALSVLTITLPFLLGALKDE